MAHKLKCWVGKKTTKHNVKYTNQSTKEAVVIVAGFGSSYVVYNGKFPNITPTIDKVFENRQNAVKFAHSYMKKHDRC